MTKSYRQLTGQDKTSVVETYYKFKDLSMDEIADYLNLSKRSIPRVLQESGINTNLKNRYTLNNSYFSSIDTEHKAYWLGYLFADGFVGDDNFSNVSLSSIDMEILEKFKIDIEFTGEIRESVLSGFNKGLKNSKPIYTLNFSSKKMSDDLRKLGIKKNRKEENVNIPIIRSDLNNHFLRGYIDGDGSIYAYTRKYNIKNKLYSYNRIKFDLIANDVMVIFFKTLLPDVSFTFGKSKTVWLKFIQVQSKLSLRILFEFIYKDATIFLNRKHIVWKNFYKS